VIVNRLEASRMRLFYARDRVRDPPITSDGTSWDAGVWPLTEVVGATGHEPDTLYVGCAVQQGTCHD